jgi:hypothetical protein
VGAPHGAPFSIQPSRHKFILENFRRKALLFAMRKINRIIVLPCILLVGASEASGGSGKWYSDPSSGCEVWWDVGDESMGRIRWTGACRNGQADGFGTVEWIDDESSPPVKFSTTFVGNLRRGKLDGSGEWRATDQFTNVINSELRTGTWRAGLRQGQGREVRTRRFLDGSFKALMDRFSGNFKADRYEGEGRGEHVKVHTDGMIEFVTDRGQFRHGSLAEGSNIRFWKHANGDESFELSEGRHAEMQFAGYGRRLSRSKSQKGVFVSLVNYPGGPGSEGSGVTQYQDGAIFHGKFEFTGMPKAGFCVIGAASYAGPCKVIVRETSSFSWENCLAPSDQETRCLKVIAKFVS